MNPILLCAVVTFVGILAGYTLPSAVVLIIFFVLIVVAAVKWIRDYVAQEDTGLFGVPAKVAPMAVAIFAGAMGIAHVVSDDTRLATVLSSL